MKLYVLFLFAFVVCTARKCKRKQRASCNWLENGVDENDRNIIVTKHNDLRIEIAQGIVPNQPRGVNLKRLSWDQSLADEAQELANGCEFEHQTVNDSRFYVGQNLAEAYSTAYTLETDWDGIVQLWFDEHQVYTYPDDPSESTGHYTQVVWADTELVGCGYTYYEKDDDEFKYHKLYVCNYGPGGNIIGDAPYETGNSGCENLC